MSVCIHIKCTLLYESFCHILRSDKGAVGTGPSATGELPITYSAHTKSSPVKGYNVNTHAKVPKNITRCKCPCVFTSKVHSFMNHFVTFLDQIKVRLGQARALPVNCLLHIRSQLKLIGKHEAGAVTL